MSTTKLGSRAFQLELPSDPLAAYHFFRASFAVSAREQDLLRCEFRRAVQASLGLRETCRSVVTQIALAQASLAEGVL
jgi:hypothetical protein